MKRILVAGGTGLLGAHVVSGLKRRGCWVRVLTRRPAYAHADVDDVVSGDVQHLDSLRDACATMDAVFSAAGASLALKLQPGSKTYTDIDERGTLNLLQAAEAARVEKFTYVSVFTPASMDDLAYVRAHRVVEEALRRSALSTSVVRPTGFFSAYGDLLPIVRLGLAPLIGDGTARTNPIHEADLAEICVESLLHEEGTVEAGGPEIHSRKGLFELAFEAVGKQPRFVRVPNGLIGFNRRAVALLDRRLSDLLAFFQSVNQTDAVAPAHGTRRLEPFFRALASRSAAS